MFPCTQLDQVHHIINNDTALCYLCVVGEMDRKFISDSEMTLTNITIWQTTVIMHKKKHQGLWEPGGKIKEEDEEKRHRERGAKKLLDIYLGKSGAVSCTVTPSIPLTAPSTQLKSICWWAKQHNIPALIQYMLTSRGVSRIFRLSCPYQHNEFCEPTCQRFAFITH